MVIHAIRSHYIRGTDKRPSSRAIMGKWPYIVIHPEVSLVLSLGDIQNQD